MSETNPYQTPESNLQEETYGSNYQANPNWDINSALHESWRLIRGFKTTLLGALLMYLGILFAVSLPFELMGKDSVVMIIVSQIVIALVTYPISAGITMLGIKRSVGEPANAFMVFDYYSKTVSLFFLYAVMMILIGIGLVLLILPGIYLMVAYSMAMPLLVEKNMGIWEALETSRKRINKCWFEMLVLYILVTIIILLAILPLGIGLLWAVPFAIVLMAVVYRNLFGVSQKI
jgi:hypothetical protein